jgi:hypothetical protein
VSTTSKIGFVTIPAPEVLHLATQSLETLQAKKAERANVFVQRIMDAPMGWIGRLMKRKPMTREQAIKAIEDDTWLGHEWYYMTDYVGPKEESLLKLVNVAKNTNGDMTVAINIANWFYPEEPKL